MPTVETKLYSALIQKQVTNEHAQIEAQQKHSDSILWTAITAGQVDSLKLTKQKKGSFFLEEEAADVVTVNIWV